MSRPLIFALPGNEVVAARLSALLDAELSAIETRRFPDEETYLRFPTDLSGRSVILVCTLDRPDPKFLPLVFAAAAARDLGARRVGLVAPYLAYMRQDKRFREGEAITSTAFAPLLSSGIDWLVTVDPHLHRYSSLDVLYPIASQVVRAAPALAEWIKGNVEQPFLIGPDVESDQWVEEVSQLTDAPYRVLRKERRGDRDVEVTVPDLQLFEGRTPVLVDDIVSSGRTMLETLRHLRDQNLPPAVCIAVHALFSDETYTNLRKIASQVVTTNTVLHHSNAIDLTSAIAPAVAAFA